MSHFIHLRESEALPASFRHVACPACVLGVFYLGRGGGLEANGWVSKQDNKDGLVEADSVQTGSRKAERILTRGRVHGILLSTKQTAVSW